MSIFSTFSAICCFNLKKEYGRVTSTCRLLVEKKNPEGRIAAVVEGSQIVVNTKYKRRINEDWEKNPDQFEQCALQAVFGNTSCELRG